jgi:ABC-type nitrate/sulfonate/bicarbonate transport system substrate-binding protein
MKPRGWNYRFQNAEFGVIPQNLNRQILFFLSFVAFIVTARDARAQSSLKKVRIGVSETLVGYLPLQVAYHRGFYKEKASNSKSFSFETFG